MPSTCLKAVTALALLPLTLSAGWGQQTQQKPADAATHTGPGGTVEHWDVLPLSGNTLHPIRPEVGEKDTLPKFTRELLRVEWRFGDPIDLYVIRPVGVAKPPVVLFLYGYPTDTDRFRDDTLCENLTKDGFAAVGFVSALTGQRYHDRPMKEWFISELEESLATSVHDVQEVLNYLDTRGDLDMSHVGMFGQGSGGTIAIFSASAEPRIKAVDALDPWGDWPDWLAKSPQVPENERARYLTPEFLAKVAPLDPIHVLPTLTAPLRMEETLFSPVTPDAARKRMAAALPPGAQHVQYGTVAEYREKAAKNGEILSWLRQQLKPAVPAKPH